MWNIKSIKAIPVVVGTIGSTSKKMKKCIEELRVVISTALLQKTALLWTACILRKLLDCGEDLWKQGWGHLIRDKKKCQISKYGGGEGNCSKTEQVRKNAKV